MKTKLYLIKSWLLCAVLLQTFPGGAQTVTQIAAGDYHSLFVRNDGSLWGMGDDTYGELGDGTFNNAGVRLPEQTVTSNVTAIAGGFFYSLFLKSDHSLWAMGQNSAGVLGDGTFNNTGINLPEEIVSSNVTAVAGGGFHSLFLKSDGSLWAMGDNNAGQLGDGTYNNNDRPEQIVASNVTAIAGGMVHSLFLKSDGSLWAMGDDTYGQLGDGTFNNTNRPEEIVSSNVTAIAGGIYHSLFLKGDGSLWAMGWNYNGQLGDGTHNNTNRPEQIVASNVTAIAAGGDHSLFLKNDGSLWAVGGNYHGQLGDGTFNDTAQPEQILASNVTAIAGGYEHTLFLKSGGILWAMGDNDWAQLGDGAAENYSCNPIQIAPTALQFGANPTSGGVPFAVQFTAPSIDSFGDAITNWSWNFGDGSTGTAQNPSHLYTNAGAFSPSLIANNAFGSPIPASGPSINALYLLLNGGFETGDFSGWTPGGNFTSCSVIAGPPYARSGTYGAQLGPSGSLGYLSQTLPTTAGVTYLLSFWFDSPDGATPNEFSVSWNGTTLLDKKSWAAIGWTNFQFVVTASSTNTALQFGFRNDNSFLGLDDISVAPAAPPVITGIHLSGTNLVLTGNSGLAAATYYTLMSTNLIQWIPVATNVLGANGNFTITATNTINPNFRQQFYQVMLVH